MSTLAAVWRAMRLSWVPNGPTALWRPGVSVSTSWPRFSSSTARIVLRVVWATGETMETFSPTSVLTRVDLPLLARPTTPTTAWRGAGEGTVCWVSDMGFRAGTRRQGVVREGRQMEQK